MGLSSTRRKEDDADGGLDGDDTRSLVGGEGIGSVAEDGVSSSVTADFTSFLEFSSEESEETVVCMLDDTEI